MYDYFACMHACGPHASEEDFRAPGTGVTDTCEPPCGCWDRTWVLCNSSKCSAIFPQPLPHPIYCFYSWCLVSLYVFWIFAVCSLFPLQFDLGIFSEVGIKAKFFLRKILKASASHLGLPPHTHTHLLGLSSPNRVSQAASERSPGLWFTSLKESPCFDGKAEMGMGFCFCWWHPNSMLPSQE